MNNTKKFDFNKKISINFEWWEITWNAGLLAFHEFCEKLQIQKLLQTYLPETRKWNFEHIKPEIIYQKIIRIASWDTSNNNYEYHIKDPSFLKIHNSKIASAPTCSRLENTFDFSDAINIKKIISEVEKYNILFSKTKEIILDIDSSNDPSSEKLEWSKFIFHYWLNWFAPLFMFNGLNWDFISWILKPWNYHCSSLSYSMVREKINFYRDLWVKDINLRWDSAFPNDNLMWECEKNNVYYFFKLKTYWNLKQYFLDDLKKKGINDISKIRWKTIFVEFEHQAQNWSKERRIIWCVDWKQAETSESKKNRKKNWNKGFKQLELFPVFSFVITNNLKLSPEEVFSMYNWRATIETCIEEAKNWFGIDELSNSKFRVNSTNFQIFCLTIQLVQLFRKFTLSKNSRETIKQKEIKKNNNFKLYENEIKKFNKLKQWRKIISFQKVDTIRKKVFNIPAKIVHSWRQIFFKCASSFKFKDLFFNILDTIKTLPKLYNLCKIE